VPHRGQFPNHRRTARRRLNPLHTRRFWKTASDHRGHPCQAKRQRRGATQARWRSTRSRPKAGARGLTNLSIWRTPPPTLHIDYTNFTERTIDSPERYLAEVELVAAQGYAEDHEEHESFVNCIAVAIRGGTGTVAAAVSMSVPDMRLNHEQVLATLPQVRTAAEAISDELGWDPRRENPTMHAAERAQHGTRPRTVMPPAAERFRAGRLFVG
jgi:hypothetical protein